MNVSIGINPITWTNDDLPSLGAGISLETCLTEAAAAGYAGIEMGGRFPRTPAQLRALLDAHGLRLISGWYSGSLGTRDAAAEFEHMAPHLDLLRAMGVDFVIFAETARGIQGERGLPVRLRPHLAAAGWSQFMDRLNELARRMAAAGMRLVFHHHMGTVVQSATDIDHMMELAQPDVELLLDTGHLVFAGADPLAVLERHGARIGHVHCKDVRASVLARSLNRNASFLDAVIDGVFAVPGDGCVDFGAVVERLARLDYRGWLVVEAEQDPAVAHPATHARRGFVHLSALVQRHQAGATAR